MLNPFDTKEKRDLWLCLLVPPLIVKRKRGIGTDFYISIELTILGWIPGSMMAVYMLYAVVPSEQARSEEQHGLSDLSGSSYEGSSENDRPLQEERNRGKRNRGNEIDPQAFESGNTRGEIDRVGKRPISNLGNRKENETRRELRKGKREQGKGTIAMRTQE